MTTADVLRAADYLIDDLYRDNQELRERCSALEDVAASLGRQSSGALLVAQVAVRMLGEQRRAHERLQAQHRHLVEEFRRFRESAPEVPVARRPERAA